MDNESKSAAREVRNEREVLPGAGVCGSGRLCEAARWLGSVSIGRAMVKDGAYVACRGPGGALAGAPWARKRW